jgi:hypothetical protein
MRVRAYGRECTARHVWSMRLQSRNLMSARRYFFPLSVVSEPSAATRTTDDTGSPPETSVRSNRAQHNSYRTVSLFAKHPEFKDAVEHDSTRAKRAHQAVRIVHKAIDQPSLVFLSNIFACRRPCNLSQSVTSAQSWNARRGDVVRPYAPCYLPSGSIALKGAGRALHRF